MTLFRKQRIQIAATFYPKPDPCLPPPWGNEDQHSKLAAAVRANKGPKYLATNSMQIYFSVGKTSLPHGWDMIHFSGYGESEGKGRDFAEMTSLHPSSPNPQKFPRKKAFPFVRIRDRKDSFLLKAGRR